MGWPYRFLPNLTEEQKDIRRILLDTYAFRAQLSVLVPLLLLQLYFLVSWIVRRQFRGGKDDVPSSPRGKESRGSSARWLRDVENAMARARWWGGEEVEGLGLRIGGRKGEVLGASVWMGWLLVLCIVQTGDDYFHLTKRFGIIAASQLPLQYLLALKTPYSPLQYITRSSHETLNSLHQLLGRITTILLYLHAIFYLGAWITIGNLASKIQEWYVLAGIFGIGAFTAVGTTALSPVRQWSYRIFYVTHVTLATALLPVLFFHVSHIRIYLYETSVVYAVNIILRSLASTTAPASMRVLPGTNLLEIDVPQPQGVAVRQMWAPGQHAYVSLPGHPMLRTFRSNPFTVASIPAVDGNLRFVARILDGNTAKLAKAADESKRQREITVEGPYGVITHAEKLLAYDRILFVAGGVGATFIVPLYRQLLADLSPSKGSHRRQRVSFLWSVKSRAEINWALPAEAREREGFLERLTVFVTGCREAGNMAGTSGGVALGEPADDAYGETDEGIELEEQKNLLSSKADEDGKTAPDGLKILAGRPNISKILDQTFSRGHGSERVAVVVCGPSGLTRGVRDEVGRWVGRGRDIWFWAESFGY
ncbi:hypothetical protein LTR86_008013 [Recurvomyces mirabilis]|nr:hypothetical protein LTR86_008013 [Recurvomyces mirabilis]